MANDRARSAGENVDVIMCEQLGDAARSAALSSTTRSRLRRGLLKSRMREIAPCNPSVVAGLVTNENAPRDNPC
jgi:hypothetical protein